MKIIVSNGSFKFHLSSLAAELEKRQVLKKLFTGGYPTNLILFFFRRSKNKAFLRFLDRGADKVSYKRVSPDNFSELFMRFGVVMVRKHSQNFEQKISIFAMHIYSLYAAIKLLFLNADIYHYRNCYGGISVKVAQLKGMKTVCDHSIAHPWLIEYMTINKGQYPAETELMQIQNKMMPLFRKMEKDFHHNDIIFVNSDFVKETMVFCGIEEKRIKVLYWGVDDNFLGFIPQFKSNSEVSKKRMLFAGGLQQRKGVLELLSSLGNTNIDLHIDFAGGIDPEIANNAFVQAFFSRDNVNYLGILSRLQLANLMCEHRVFIFTSYCEGSARVIFEALAAGLFVITTANSGSIVRHMENGLIVKPGDEADLMNAIKWVTDESNQSKIDEIRRWNFDLIRSNYTQAIYGDKILDRYSEIINN